MTKDNMYYESSTIVKDRRKNLWSYAKKKYIWLIYILLIMILIINVNIRTLPLDINPATNKPGLWNIRGAERIIDNGSLGEVDMMRFYPLGYNTAGETKILPYSIAYLHKLFVFLGIGDGSVTYAAIWLPVLFSIITALAFFFLVRKIFEEKGELFSNFTALIGTAFLVTLPSLLPRTIAGIPEKESMGFTFMFLSLYFFISAWKNDNAIKNIGFAIMAGLFTGLMGLVWGGVIFVYIAIALSGFIAFLMEKIDKKEIAVYWTWLLASMLFWIPWTARMTIKKFMRSPTTGISIMIGILMLTYYILFNTKIRKKIPQTKIPKSILTLIISGIIVLILSSIFLGPATIFVMGDNVVSTLGNPYVTRIAFTVAENKQPYFSDWRRSMGPIFNGFPLFFWLFFAGSIMLFYEVIKNYNIKERGLLITGYVLFLVCLIFSRSSPNDILNGETGIAVLMYMFGYFILFISVGYVVYDRLKSGKSLEVNANIGYIFVFSLVFVGIIAGRSAIRLLMVLVAIAIIPLSYIIVNSIFEAYKKRNEDVIKILFVCFAVFAVFSGIMILNYQYKSINAMGKNHMPNYYTHQWQYAMKWVDDNTPEDAVFIFWWDYGYWVQTMGNRATMLDGGNSYPYWNYLMGRHGLTAESEQEALDLAYSHNITHFLIDSSEIGKYSAYSNIGSDEEYDRFSWIGTFHLDDSQTVETRNTTSFIYTGGIALDEDLILNETLLPAIKTGVGAMIVDVSQDGEIENAYIYTVYNGIQLKIPLRYVYYEGVLIDFGTGVEGCVYIFPKLVDGSGYNPKGSALFLSPRNMRALWVQMYLLDNVEHFKLVHTEANIIVKDLRRQGMPSRDLIYYKGIQGPIKIWEIEYTGNEVFNEEYMLLDYPEHLIGRKNR